MNQKTICQLVNKTVALTTDKKVLHNLWLIRQAAEHMEDRMQKYCNALEDLGFVRIGRDDNNQ